MNRFNQNVWDKKKGLRFGESAACPSTGTAHDQRLRLAGTAPTFLPKPALGLSEESESWN